MIFAEILHTKYDVLRLILFLYLDGRSSEEILFLCDRQGYDYLSIDKINDILDYIIGLHY